MSPIPKSDRKRSIQLNRRLRMAGAAWLAVVAGLVAFAGDVPPQSAPAPWPVGKAVGAVAFDGVVEEDAPFAGAKTLLFLEYTVSPRAIAYDIIWAEPCWKTIAFPCPPTGTSLYAVVGNGARADAEGLPAHDRALRGAGLGVIADLAAAQLAEIRANWGRVEGDSEE